MGMRQLKISNSITTRESASLQKYLQEIDKVELLTPDDEVQLTIRIRQGDQNALDRLTKANLRFVVSVAKQYQGQGLSLQDLINEGNLGLIKAASKFDDTRGFRFISFAVWWIRQNILQALAEHARMIRLPLNKVALSNRIRRVQSELEQRLERNPSVEELADELQMDVDDIRQVLGQGNHHVSLDTPFSEDEDSTLLDTLENLNAKRSDAELYHNASLQTEITRSLEMLSIRQRETLCCFFGIGVEYPMSLEDIANKFDLTTERVRQIKDKALIRLRAMQNMECLREFLGK
jgi:RNA polymerase primary sigma factor